MILNELTWTVFLVATVALYTLSIAIYLILENRSPQSTFAWLFLLLIFPIGGLVVYGMFGRSWRAFSRGKILTKLLRGTELAERSGRLIAVQPEKIEELAQGANPDCARLATMLWASSGAPLTTANRLEILQNASEKYPRLLDDMRAATQSIHLLYYEWASDPFTEEVGRLLGEKVKQGVQVRILYDPVGSFWMLRHSYVRWMRGMGIQMYPFAPIYYLHTLSYRNHRKIAIVDGRVAYSGGLNMTEKHLTGPDGFSGWRDTHTRAWGETALVLQGVFATMWHNTTGENVFQDEYFPEIDESSAHLPIQVVSAGPDSEWKVIRQSYLAMIGLARKHVYVQSPFLILDDSLSETLKSAALSGVDVQLMIAPRGGELSPAYRAGMTYAVDMARAGVAVLMYQGEYFHAKTVCVDTTLCSIGSANMDIRSFAINYETNLVIYDESVTAELEADFKSDLEKCVPFTVGEYKSRPVLSRFVDSTMRLCSPLI